MVKKMDMNDILHSLYFTMEWGTQTDKNDKTFDVEFTPIASQAVQTIIGIKPIDENTIDVYVDYWHFDEGKLQSGQHYGAQCHGKFLLQWSNR